MTRRLLAGARDVAPRGASVSSRHPVCSSMSPSRPNPSGGRPRRGRRPTHAHPHPERPAMRPPQWEYKTVEIDVSGWLNPKVEPELVDAELNRYGEAGWE